MTIHNCIRILAYNIKQRRKVLGETQEYVAEKAGVSYRAYQSLESGRGNPSVKTLESIATFFKVSVGRLFELTMVRTQSLPTFLQAVKRKFSDSKISVFICDMDGVILWGNDSYLSITGSKADLVEFPFDMMEYLSLPLREVYRSHLEAQRRGFVQPLMKLIESSDGERRVVRTYCISVYEKNYIYPAMGVGYACLTSKDSEEYYYEFTRKVLDIMGDHSRRQGQR